MTLEIIPGALYKIKNEFFAAISHQAGGAYLKKDDIVFLLKQNEVTKYSIHVSFLSKDIVFHGWFELNIITNFMEKC